MSARHSCSEWLAERAGPAKTSVFPLHKFENADQIGTDSFIGTGITGRYVAIAQCAESYADGSVV